MLFFVRQLQLAKALKNPTIVMLTDRNDLDDQLFGDIQRPWRGAAQDAACRRTTRPRCDDLLNGRHRRPRLHLDPEVSWRGGRAPAADGASNVIVIADEAHRTPIRVQETLRRREEGVREQVGFAEYVRQALPNATFVGFTGTPIDLATATRERVFGDVIDTYDMAQSVADKATVRSITLRGSSSCGCDSPTKSARNWMRSAEELTEGDEAAVERAKESSPASRKSSVHRTRERRSLPISSTHFEHRREAMARRQGHDRHDQPTRRGRNVRRHRRVAAGLGFRRSAR